MVALTNEFRVAEGRGAVETESHLQAAAREFARFMARTGRYGHGADGREPADRAKAQGYDYCLVSENISYQYSTLGFRTGELASRLVEGWKSSPGHRRNMLEEGVMHTGVAVAQSESTGRYYAVQLFGRPRSQQRRFRVRNDAGAPVRYQLGGEPFTLAVRETHTHERCARETLKLEGEEKGPEPRHDDEFVVARGKQGPVLQRRPKPPS